MSEDIVLRTVFQKGNSPLSRRKTGQPAISKKEKKGFGGDNAQVQKKQRHSQRSRKGRGGGQQRQAGTLQTREAGETNRKKRKRGGGERKIFAGGFGKACKQKIRVCEGGSTYRVSGNPPRFKP